MFGKTKKQEEERKITTDYLIESSMFIKTKKQIKEKKRKNYYLIESSLCSAIQDVIKVDFKSKNAQEEINGIIKCKTIEILECYE